MVSIMDDFPIDPALLAEEEAMMDAEGEADGDFEVDEVSHQLGLMSKTITD